MIFPSNMLAGYLNYTNCNQHESPLVTK